MPGIAYVRSASIVLVLASALCAGCGQGGSAAPGASAAPQKRPPTQITVIRAKTGPIEEVEFTLGILETQDDPRLSAEIAGRLAALAVTPGEAVRRGQVLAEIDPADARLQNAADLGEVERLRALLAQQERVVARQADLTARNFVSRNALDEATAQREALQGQLAAAESRARLSGRSIGKARIVAPNDAIVDEVLVATGDYLKLGDPVLRLVTTGPLRVALPFSEAVAPRLKRGLPVRIGSPLAPGSVLAARIDDLRPQVSDGGRNVVAIARLKPDPRLRAGATVDARVVIERKPDAVLVPEQSVVLRPAGKVVYAIADGKAKQRIVETGAQEGGFVEITRGLAAGETVALDGAGFLSNDADVAVKAPVQAGGRPGGS